MITFKDRFDAGEKLAEKLMQYKNNKQTIIIAIPRGGVEIGSALATQLHLPLGVIFAKKIGAPHNPELAIGAVTAHEMMIDPLYENNPMISAQYIKDEVERIRNAIQKKIDQYRHEKAPIILKDKTVIVTDDGIATGNTMRLVIQHIKKQKAKKIIVALPVGPADEINRIKTMVDEVVCLETPPFFYGVSQFYQRFEQVDDEKAIALLDKVNI